jgi:hypothetical protein
MRRFYGDSGDGVFAAYGDLMLRFNDALSECAERAATESYTDFFENLKKHERAAVDIYYFMETNCDLIEKFCDFLNKR